MTNEGSCLCGSVTWELTAEPFTAYNCYCTMCRKLHGSAFSTFYRLLTEHVRWTSDTDTIVHYKSSHLTRCSCGVCGSSVPLASKNHNGWAVPAGCHNEGKKIDCNIFTVDTAPWHQVSGGLPCYDAYPPETGYPSMDDKPLPRKPDGLVRGSCLCGAIAFHVTEPFKRARNCHCSRCRHARSAAHASNGFTSFDGVQFLTGENHLKSYKVPEASHFTQDFCDICSSPMPRLDAARKIAVIPLGALDDDPGVRPLDHIFVASKAGWHEITDDLPSYEEGPPS